MDALATVSLISVLSRLRGVCRPRPASARRTQVAVGVGELGNQRLRYVASWGVASQGHV